MAVPGQKEAVFNALRCLPYSFTRIIRAGKHKYRGTRPIDLILRMNVPQEFGDIIEWHDYVKDLSANILNGEMEGYFIEMEKRDLTNVANFSCIPWIDFDMLTNCVVDGAAIQPLITWGKVNENYEMSVSITVSHIFVNGRELGYFYENAQQEFDRF